MNLKRAALAGLAWSSASELTVGLLQAVQLIVLARLLSAEDFGLFAIAITITSLVAIFADTGVNDAIVQREAPTDAELSSLYWLNIGMGCLLFLLIVAAAGPVSVALAEPRLQHVLILCALPVLIGPFGHQFGLLLQKNLRFGALTSIEAFSALVATAVGISAALAGAGVLSLVYAQIAGAVTSLLALNIVGRQIWTPSLHFAKSDLKGYLGFGLYILAQRAVGTVSGQIDKLVVGLFLGQSALGAYYVALRIAELPLQKFMAVSARVLLPIFARRQNQIELLRYGYLVSVRGLATIGMPVSLGLAVTAPWIVPVMLGPGWQDSVLPLQVLAASNIFLFANIPGHVLVLARGKANLQFLWTLMSSASRIPFVLLGTWAGGVAGLVFALAVLGIAVFYPFYRIMVRSQIGSCLRETFRELLPPVGISLAMTVAVLAFMRLWQEPSAVGLGLAVALGAAVFGFGMILFQRRHLQEAWRLFKEKTEAA